MNKFKIKVCDAIDSESLKEFTESRYIVDAHLEEPNVLLVRSKNLHDFPFTPEIQAVGRAGAGTDNIPVKRLTEAGIPVFFTPGANANAVKELVIAGMLLAARKLDKAWLFTQTLSKDQPIEAIVEQEKKQFRGTELSGKTLGVIGLGQIGVRVANAALDLGMKVIAYDPHISISNAYALSPEVSPSEHIVELLKQSDFVTLHVPLSSQTKKLISQEALSALNPSSILLNFSRGEIIDQEALLAALQAKKFRAYVHDFPSSILLNHPQIISFPHLGASTIEAEKKSASSLVRSIRDFLEHGNIKNAVNFPDLHLAPAAPYRLAMVHENKPGMLANISEILAKEKYNISTLLNKSRDLIAYSLIDINQVPSALVLNKIKNLSGIIRVWTLLSDTL